jgi:Protein of unknown function (DUF3515)
VPDPTTRSAARLAALIAVPVAVLAGLGTFAVLHEPETPPPPAATSPVRMTARTLSEREEIVCRALLSQLPAEADGLSQRPVTEGPEQNAAYGDPPITIECGVPPADYRHTDQVWPWEGVCWHAAELPDRTVWTTLDREVPVRVTVPIGYQGPFQHVISFSDTVADTIRSTAEAPTGCRA